MRILVSCMLFLLLCIFSSTATEVNAQVLSNIDPATVNVDQLSDSQVSDIYNRITGEDLTIPEAMELAKLQGLPESEASKLQVRLMQLQASGGSTSSNNQTIRPLSEDEVEEIQSDEEIGVMSSASGTGTAPTVIVDASGDPGDIYGHSIFLDQSLDVFTTTDAARAPDWYVLGTGDQIRVTIFGVSQNDLLLEISEDGYVQPSGGQRIFLKGLTIKEARSIISTRLREIYTFNEDEFVVTIKAARTITVNIFGESRAKGGFTISALNTAFNALTVAGGPTIIGSVRDIQLIRGDERLSIDVYEYLNDPTVQTMYTLRHNDIIFVPIAKNIVQIDGAVKRPMRYELKDDEGLIELINYAGGINFDTETDFVQIERIVNGEPILLEYELIEILNNNIKVDLIDGDIVRVRSINKGLEQFVTIEGGVFYPGTYDFNNSSSLFLLLEEAMIQPEAMTERIFVERIGTDNSIDIIPVKLDSLIEINQDFELQKKDKIIIFEKERYRTLATIEVLGQVRNPFKRSLDFEEKLKLSDALKLAGGLQPTALNVAYIFRTDIFNPDFIEHIRVNLDDADKVYLQPGDQLRVYNKQDYTDFGDLSIQGAVTDNFSTTYDSTLTVSDMILMAGGLSRNAALNNVEVFRLNISLDRGTLYDIIKLEIGPDMNVIEQPNNFKLQPFDKIIVRRIPEYDFGATIEINGEVKYPGIYPIDGQRLRLTDVIKLAGGLTTSADPQNATILRSTGNVGPIGVDLAAALDNENNYTTINPVILENDVIRIPEYENIVQIRINGTRYGDLREDSLIAESNALSDDNTINIIYRGNKNAKWYIDRFAGGLGSEADKWSITITNPDGEIRGVKRSFFFFKNYPQVEPGSIITLRNRPPKPPREGSRIDLQELQARTLQATTTILTILILADRLQQ